MVVKGDDLSALKLRHGWEERLEHPADGVSKAGDEAVENEFGEVSGGAGVSLPDDKGLTKVVKV